jgi:hypothetical protein
MLTLYFYYDSLNRRRQLSWVDPNGALIRTYYFDYKKQNLRNKFLIIENNKFRSFRYFYNSDGNLAFILSALSINWPFYYSKDEYNNYRKSISIKLSVNPNRYYLPDISVSILRRSVTYF